MSEITTSKASTVASDPRTEDTGNSTMVNVTRDSEQHEVTTVRGDTVNYHSTSDVDTSVDGKWPAEADQHVRKMISDAISDREARENVRANHRNLNRMLTLLGALVIGLVVTYVLQHKGVPGLVHLPSWSFGLAPYSFVITVLLDTGLAIYGLVKHY